MFLLAAVLLQSCGNKTGHAVGDSEALVADTLAAEPLTNESLSEVNVDKHSEAYIRQRVDAMYETVGRPTYDSDGNRVEYIENPFNRDSAYCSKRYYTLMQQALQVCEETGDILYDYDHWVCGQDFSDDWSCEVKSVYEVTDSTEETLASLTMRGRTSSGKAPLILRTRDSFGEIFFSANWSRAKTQRIWMASASSISTYFVVPCLVSNLIA